MASTQRLLATRNRIEALLRNDVFFLDEYHLPNSPRSETVPSISYGHVQFSSVIHGSRPWLRHDGFSRFLIQEMVKSQGDYVDKMNSLLSTSMSIYRPSQDQNIQQRVLGLLGRMPALPRRIYDLFQLEHHEFFGITKPKPWNIDLPIMPLNFEHEEQYFTTKFEREEKLWRVLVDDWPIDDNTLRIALQVAELEETRAPNLAFGRDLHEYINFLAYTLDSMYQFHHPVPEGSAPRDATRWIEATVILRFYISVSWQQTSLLLLYYVTGVILKEGWSEEWSALFGIKTPSNTTWGVTYNQPKYMCSQALELLRRSKAAASLDFRGIFSRFEILFSGRKARCDPEFSDYLCDGNIPRSCTRFAASSSVQEQSMHDVACVIGRCHRICWNADSYDSFDDEGPRAVKVGVAESLAEVWLSYCMAGAETLAISHVWSHGQGGRPETGINSCLHARYANLAGKHGCSSYWIDTCCIPTDDKRRTRAIKGINFVFESSKVTIICDKDIMSIDAQATDADENLLTVLCVADWNVRGWTLLEAIKGSLKLHLLCKDNETVRFSTLNQRLHHTGPLDLIAFLPAVQHLLPKVHFGYENTGYLLGRRHSSRPGDEAVIWGLISRNIASQSPLHILQSLSTIKTGFLVSYMPRMEVAGYHWAPAVAHYGDDFSGFDGEGSEIGYITPDGLLSTWLVHEIHNVIENSDEKAMEERYRMDISISTCLSGRKMSPDGDWIQEPPGNMYKRLIFIQAKSRSSSLPYVGGEKMASYRLIILCGSNDGTHWIWLQAIPFNAENKIFDNVANYFEERRILLA